MNWILGVPEILHELRQQTKLMLRQNELTQEQLHESDRILRVLWKISDTLSEIQGSLFPVPTNGFVTFEGASPVSNVISKPFGQTVTCKFVEVDNTKTPPAPFTQLPSSNQWSQDTLAFGALVVDPATGFASIVGANDPGKDGVVVVTCVDNTSNPGTVISNTGTITFTTTVPPAVVPNHGDVDLS